MNETAKELKSLLNSPKKIVITTHRSPDGDAIGSSLALYHFLRQLRHSVSVITPDNYADFLHWMPDNTDVIIYEEEQERANSITKKADLIFMLDFNHIDRLSTFSDIVLESKATKVLIDHHQDPDITIADLIFSDVTACSTAELVFDIIEEIEMSNLLNKEIAECLYVGIMTDTGSFKYNSTTARTHKIVAKLIDAGAQNSKIHDLIYDNSSANRIKLLGYCLNEKLLLYPENNAAIISLTAQELKRFNFKKGDTEGFVNYCLAIKGISFAAFITEKQGVVKLSLRSKGNVAVNEIAKKYFQGGGHINASGGVSQESVCQTIKKLEKIINNLK